MNEHPITSQTCTVLLWTGCFSVENVTRCNTNESRPHKAQTLGVNRALLSSKMNYEDPDYRVLPPSSWILLYQSSVLTRTLAFTRHDTFVMTNWAESVCLYKSRIITGVTGVAEHSAQLWLTTESPLPQARHSRFPSSTEIFQIHPQEISGFSLNFPKTGVLNTEERTDSCQLTKEQKLIQLLAAAMRTLSGNLHSYDFKIKCMVNVVLYWWSTFYNKLWVLIITVETRSWKWTVCTVFYNLSLWHECNNVSYNIKML